MVYHSYPLSASKIVFLVKRRTVEHSSQGSGLNLLTLLLRQPLLQKSRQNGSLLSPKHDGRGYLGNRAPRFCQKRRQKAPRLSSKYAGPRISGKSGSAVLPKEAAKGSAIES